MKKHKNKEFNVILCNFFLHTGLKKANVWKELFFELCDDYYLRYYQVDPKKRKIIGAIPLSHATIKRKITEYEKPNEPSVFHIGFCIEITTLSSTHWIKLVPAQNEPLPKRMKQIKNWIGLLSSMSEVEQDNKIMRKAEDFLAKKRKEEREAEEIANSKDPDNVPNRSETTSPEIPLFSDRSKEKTDPIRERFYSHLLKNHHQN